MNDRPASLKEKVARLRAAFVAQLPARLAEVRLITAAVRTDPGRLGDLHRQLHSIKGTSASFGLNNLSIVAAQAEKLAQALAEQPMDAATLMDGLERAVGTMERVVQGLEAPQAAPEARPLSFELAPTLPEPGQESEQGRLVYLCDDDRLMLDQPDVQLCCFGYRTATFTDPELLREAIAAQRPHAVVMDIVFPDSDTAGTEVISALQRDQASPLPTIFVSGRRDFDARLRAVKAGGSAFFTKPVKAIDLVEALDTLTARHEPEPLRVLVVDDEPEVATYHALILQDAGISTRIINAPEQLLDALHDFRPDLVLMDMYMPVCNGRELAQVIRQIPDFLSLPIVYLSSETDVEKQFRALRVGADGFLNKPIEPDQLVSAVAVRAERMRALRALMVRDSLTGLFNHTTTKQFLDSAVANARRRGTPVCFAMLDVDRFKSVNDTYGHPAGDQVLLALSRVLQQRLRNSDVVGRYGGEEFAVVLDNVQIDRAMRIMNGLREDFSKVRFYAGNAEFSCTFSCGIAAFPEFGSPEMLNEAADKALYRAKHEGRNRVVASRC